MATQKDLKRIVRSRMRKTGESYTTARVRVVRKKKPTPNYAERAALSSDEALKAKTGRDWAGWVNVLDSAKAIEMPHGEIARFVSSLGVPGWWTQTVTVGYERIRGLRDLGQRRGGGYEATKTRTFAVPISKLYSAFSNARIRKRWLAEGIVVRSATPNKAMRTTMSDGTSVVFWFVAKSDAKSTVALAHSKLPDRATMEKMKSLWTERFEALSVVLG